MERLSRKSIARAYNAQFSQLKMFMIALTVLLFPYFGAKHFLDLIVAGQDVSRVVLEITGLAISALLFVHLSSKQSRQLAHLALYDVLTGLPNRTLFNHRLEGAVSSRSKNDYPFTVMLMDLDGFKQVNDVLGHHTGDLLLAQVGQRLGQCAKRDSDTIARLGGDEFAMIVDCDLEGAICVAEEILRVFETPFMIQDRSIDIGTSIGIVVCPGHGPTAEEVLQQADLAMYDAKRKRLGYTVYSEKLRLAGDDNLALIAELRRALDTGSSELQLHYQPKKDLRSGEIIGMEALIRWEHPERGLVSPAEFIPAVEKTPLIKPLTEWVISEAVRQCSLWREAGHDLRVAINVSPNNLKSSRILQTVTQMLRKWKVSPGCLILEVTETAIMADPDVTMKVLLGLNVIGVKLALDDFGTGHSSLLYLKYLPVQEIKIDKSFVTGMAENVNDARIVRSTIDLAHDIGCEAVAEGIEDQAVEDMLTGMSCDVMQGYHLSRPIPAHQTLEWLTTQKVKSL